MKTRLSVIVLGLAAAVATAGDPRDRLKTYDAKPLPAAGWAGGQVYVVKAHDTCDEWGYPTRATPDGEQYVPGRALSAAVERTGQAVVVRCGNTEYAHRPVPKEYAHLPVVWLAKGDTNLGHGMWLRQAKPAADDRYPDGTPLEGTTAVIDRPLYADQPTFNTGGIGAEFGSATTTATEPAHRRMTCEGGVCRPAK